MRPAIIGWQVGGDRDAANEDGADGWEYFGDLCGHNSAEGKADKRVGLTGIDLCSQAARVRWERFFRFGRDPVDITGLESFRQSDVGKKAVVGSDAGDKVGFHVIPIFRRISRRRIKVTKKSSAGDRRVR